MLKLKKLTCIIIAVTMLALTACGSKDTDSSSKATEPMPESVADTSAADSTDTESKEETTTTTTTAAEPVVTEPEVSEPDEEPVGEVIKITYKEVLDTIVEYFDPDHLDQTEAALLENLPLDPNTRVDGDTLMGYNPGESYGWTNQYNFKKNVVLVSDNGTEIKGVDIGVIQIFDGFCRKNDRNKGKSNIQNVEWDTKYDPSEMHETSKLIQPLKDAYGALNSEREWVMPNGVTIELADNLNQITEEILFIFRKPS